jgi:hypothetical protein
VIFAAEFLNSENLNFSHSHTQFVTGLVHSRTGPDASFLRYYISMSQIEGNAIGFSTGQFTDGHLFGALINDSSQTGIVYMHESNVTLRHYLFLENTGPLFYRPLETGRIDFVDCVFDVEVQEGNAGFGIALRCVWNARSVTTMPMKMLRTAFCDGNWNPTEGMGWINWIVDQRV